VPPPGAEASTPDSAEQLKSDHRKPPGWWRSNRGGLPATVLPGEEPGVSTPLTSSAG
jgi:hypothetical protein